MFQEACHIYTNDTAVAFDECNSYLTFLTGNFMCIVFADRLVVSDNIPELIARTCIIKFHPRSKFRNAWGTMSSVTVSPP